MPIFSLKGQAGQVKRCDNLTTTRKLVYTGIYQGLRHVYSQCL